MRRTHAPGISIPDLRCHLSSTLTPVDAPRVIGIWSRIRDSCGSDSHDTQNPEMPNPDARAGALLHVTPPRRAIGYREIAISVVEFPLHGKTPNAEPRLSGLLTRIQSGIYGYNPFGKSLIAISPCENSMFLENLILR
jgi:hypothetical protein